MTKILHLYRIEDKKGLGPFQSLILDKRKDCRLVEQMENHCRHLPTHKEELKKFKIVQYRNYNAAVLNKRMLLNWFSEDTINKLLKKGFRLVRISIDQSLVYFGVCQILYRPQDIEDCIEISLEELL